MKKKKVYKITAIILSLIMILVSAPIATIAVDTTRKPVKDIKIETTNPIETPKLGDNIVEKTPALKSVVCSGFKTEDFNVTFQWAKKNADGYFSAYGNGETFTSGVWHLVIYVNLKGAPSKSYLFDENIRPMINNFYAPTTEMDSSTYHPDIVVNSCTGLSMPNNNILIKDMYWQNYDTYYDFWDGACGNFTTGKYRLRYNVVLSNEASLSYEFADNIKITVNGRSARKGNSQSEYSIPIYSDEYLISGSYYEEPIDGKGNGDIDGTGQLDSNDFSIVSSICSGQFTLTPQQEKVADVNGDGVVDGFDAICIAVKISSGENY